MSSVQAPPPSSQPSGASESGRAGGKDKAQTREAEKGSDDFDKALKKKGNKNGDAKGDLKGEKKDGIEDLFRQAHSKKKEGREDSDAMAHSEATKNMEARMSKTAEVQSVDNKQMVDRIDKIVDKIMVSNAADVKAVKVEFKDGVLPGTEVMIRKDAAGKLTVEFTTTSTESFNFLNKGEQSLVDTLNKKMGNDVTVDIKMQGNEMDQNTGDGRSREQYVEDTDDKDKKDD